MHNKDFCIANKRILVKVGSNTLFDDNLVIRQTVVESLARQISALIKEKYQVVFVTSGAVMFGTSLMHEHHLTKGAFASVGQVSLIENYHKVFAQYDINIGQVLLNKHIFNFEADSKLIKELFESMMADGVLPIVNQNDPSAQIYDEFIDNDELSKCIAKLLQVGLVVFLTDVDGLFSVAPPDPNGVLIKEVYPGDERVTNFIKKTKPGGMESKLKASIELSNVGVAAYITNGRRENVILDLVKQSKVNGTFFHT